MNKVVVMLMSIMIVVSGCSVPTTISSVSHQSSSSQQEGSEKDYDKIIRQSPSPQSYSYTWEMKIPALQGVENFKMLQDGYYEKKMLNYTITKSDSDQIVDYCPTSKKVRFVAYRKHNNFTDKEQEATILATVDRDYIQEGKVIKLPLVYKGEGLGLQFTPHQRNTLAREGFVIMEPNHQFLQYIHRNASYNYKDIENSTPEWAVYYDLIGGNSDPTQRYPYNTIYVSTDLLLHTYHKLFSNSLKYYEMKTARAQVKNIATTNMKYFAELAKKAGSDTKPYYDYLTAYWSVAHILLPSEDEYTTRLDAAQKVLWNNDAQQGDDLDENGNDFSDEYLHGWLRERLATTLKSYPTQYNDAVTKLVNEILAGTDKSEDFLAEAFAPQTDPQLVWRQDYTMFLPRGHYADNTLLKTYFLGMKWLMKHKMYARDPRLLKASLLLAHHIPKQSQQQLHTLQTFVKTMIGADDDIAIEDLQEFLRSHSLKSPQDIINTSPEGRAKTLVALKPQKIISTTYINNEKPLTEAEVRDLTAGFVFFGEKFTIDSWIADQLTAGPAEQEYEYKPSVVSVYQLLDVLSQTPHWKSYAESWIKRMGRSKFNLSEKQVSSYPKLREDTKKAMSSVMQDQPEGIYTQRLKLMDTATILPETPPLYMRGTHYMKKMLNTILGTYVELKHDTLLYVKQAFAELGAGGGDDCDIIVEYEELPVPKGYVEPQFATIDALKALSESTHKFFGEINKNNFKLFHNYLDLIKNIALKQSKNELISDEEFEQLRLAGGQLENIMSIAHKSGELGTRSAVIADIFTSGVEGPYYIATGRPLLMAVLVDDINGKRAVIGPVYSTYEFYGNPVPKKAGRYTDQDWRMGYDGLNAKHPLMTQPLYEMISY